MKILIVDDDAFLRDMYATKFSQSGHDVSAAQNPADAIRILEKETTFDIILLDMVMPGMSGVELIKVIKAEMPKVTAKCVVLSNQGLEEDIQEAKSAGAIGYIIKAESVPSDVVSKVEAFGTT